MPLGIERINTRRRSPNDKIVFIKPLEGPDKALAQDFLERVAAICYPVMKANHLSVMSLEEYEPNMEFVGRNFNAGEVIQLVLKAPYTGHWLPFRHVQMVMMHELAHCKQMNHSRAFWRVRNKYCDELRLLWQRNYTGDGFWSRGQTLLSGQYTASPLLDAEALPHSLCGGTYRTSHKRKRKRDQENSRAPRLSYAERQQRKIARKFGTQGTALGEDQNSRVILEEGRKTKGKPRVASSVRGRELRAAAALQRFENQKANDQPKKEGEDAFSDSESGSDCDGPEIKEEAVDRDGKKMVDSKGRGMIQVCKSEEDTAESEDMRREMRELREMGQSRDDLKVVNAGNGADSRGRSTDQWGITISSESEPEDTSSKGDSKPEMLVMTEASPSGPGSQRAEEKVPQKPFANIPLSGEKIARKQPPKIVPTAQAGSQQHLSKRSKSPAGTTDCATILGCGVVNISCLQNRLKPRTHRLSSQHISSRWGGLSHTAGRTTSQRRRPRSGVSVTYLTTTRSPRPVLMQLANYFLQLPQLLLNFTSPLGTASHNEITSAPAIEDIVMGNYTLPPLPYAYDALEPYISAQIMTIHHQKHHQTYITNLNAALASLATFSQAKDIPSHIALQQAIKFNGGGHINHSLFWENLTPANSSGASPTAGPQIRKVITERWGSEEAFKEAFGKVLLGLQGSGWGWLVRDEEFGQLEIITTKDQDPVPAGKVPIFGVDMWEHAYYLQYLNNKAEYIKGIWHVINWDTAEKRYAGGRKDAFSVLKASM